MSEMVFASRMETPDREAVIVHLDISWPIRTEDAAYKLAKRYKLPGFWRLKVRKVERV